MDNFYFIKKDVQETGIIFCFFFKRKRVKHERIEMYEALVGRYLDTDFQSHFRMSRTNMEILIETCRSHETVIRGSAGRPQIEVSLQCMICIWVLANQESYRSIADRFNVSKSTVFQSLIRICKILNKKAQQFITWPRGEAAAQTVEGFKKMKTFPGVLDCIDGCHINICSPQKDAAAYVNRKGNPSIILQAVCDHTCSFTDCFVGFPGSVHDARVFQKSEVYNMCNNDDYFPNDTHILGDSAYPLGIHLLTPFRENGHLTRRETRYNICHAATRCTIERAFGMLKARWRRLNYLELHNTVYLPHVIMASCVLHNFCIKQKEQIPDNIMENDGDNLGGNVNIAGPDANRSAAEKRNTIKNTL